VSSKQARLHMDAAASSDGPLHRSLCGFVAVKTTSDPTAATCRLCLARLRSGDVAAQPTRLPSPLLHAITTGELAAELHVAVGAVAASLAPSAGAPPRLTAEQWASSCKGGEHRRCGECELCLWERDAQIWAHVAPYYDEQSDQCGEGARRWSTLDKALRSVAEWRAHGRDAAALRSATGVMLERLKRGESATMGTHGVAPREPKAIAASADLLDVERAVQIGARELGPDALPAVAAMYARATSDAATRPSFASLAIETGLTEPALRAAVSRLRARVTDDLCARGLLTVPRARMRTAAPVTSYCDATG
jgi:hypothetical protein